MACRADKCFPGMAKICRDGRFTAVLEAMHATPDESLIDGEIVAIDGNGLPDFNRLQNFDADTESLKLYAFDLPLYGGIDLRSKPLEVRRELLRQLIERAPEPFR